MFLHLVDDEKFVDGSAALFEACDPGNHRYVIIRRELGTPFRYIKGTHVQVVLWDSAEYREIMAGLSDYTAVFLYSLFNKFHLDLVNKAPAGATLVWFFGGGELLTTKKYWPTVMLPRTRLLYYKHRAVPWIQANLKKYGTLIRKGQFTALVHPFLKRRTPDKPQTELPLDTNLEKAIVRMDFVAPVIPEDYDQLKTMVRCKAEMLNWNYSSNFYLDQMDGWQIKGDNWLVGNAARYALNHLEILRKLSGIKGHSGKIIVPLSYGDSQLYTQDILRKGKALLGGRFEPLLELLPIEQYFSMISTCPVAFFNTPRQHAMSSILASLYLGARVYLRKENPVFRFLKRQGATVFSIQEDIPSSADALNVPLDAGTVQKNKMIVRSFASIDALMQKTNNILGILNNVK